jgi:endonuclease/exonuclease/phosphatase family metal-dependent hydrolase
MKLALLGLLVLLLGLVGLIAWAAAPWSISGSVSRPPIVTVETAAPQEQEEFASVLKMLSFNLGFLYGKGSEGPGYEFRNRGYFEKSLERLGADLRAWDVDVVFLQEIDFGAARSHGINQARFLAQQARYPFVAEAPSWTANYIPFPYWPPKNNFGRMSSGGAILSRYPLEDHEVTLLPKPLSQPWWYNLFYLHRYFQRATVLVGDKRFKLLNLHLEAFDRDDRMSQVELLVKKITAEKIDFVAGDFNMLPPSASKTTKFYSEDGYENDRSYALMQASGLAEVIPDEIYAEEEARFFTFPAWAPDRRLDYIWFQPGPKIMKAEVLPSASSDHLPLRATFQISGPRFNPYSQ